MSTVSMPPLPTGQRRFIRIVPLAFVTYSLAFLDRVNYGFAAAGRMAADLGINERASAAISASFFLGYFLFQIPGAAYASHRSAKRLIFWALLFWGALSGATGLLSSLPSLLAVRFLLGAVEGVVMPALLVYLTHWFTRGERSRANTFLILGNPITLLWASAISGYLVQACGWRTMFIVEGFPSIIWAFVWLRVADDRPRDAGWVSSQEAAAIQATLDAEQRELRPLGNYWGAFRDGRVLLLSAQLFFWSVGLYGLVLWLPKMLSEASRLGMSTIGLLAAMPYLLGVLLMIASSRGSDRTLRRRIYVWPFLLAGALAFCLCWKLGPVPFWPAYLCLVVAGGCLFAGYGPFFAVPAEIIPRNAVGEAMALINASGALGGFAGTYLIGWLNAYTGQMSASYLSLAFALLAAAGCMLLVRSR